MSNIQGHSPGGSVGAPSTHGRRLPGLTALAPSLFLGATGTWALVSHWAQPNVFPSFGAWAGLLGGTVLLTALLHRWGLPALRHGLSAFSGRGRLAWVLGCLLMAFILLRAGGLRSPKARLDAELTLIATGQHAPESRGSEIWLMDTEQSDGSLIAPEQWTLQQGQWELREGRTWISHRDQPARLHWRGEVTGPLTLRLLSHNYSGILSYEWNGQSHQLDLYHPTGSQRVLSLSLTTKVTPLARRIGSLLFHSTHVLSLTGVLLALGLWLAHRERTTSPLPSHARAWERIAYALPALVAGLVWLAMCFPGMMTSDSTDQWEQAHAGRFMDSHPVLHTAIIRLLTRVWDSPAAVGLAQVGVFSVLVSWGCMSLRRAGLPRWVAGSTALLMGLTPITGAHAITLWKDVPFSLAILALCILLFQATMHHELLSRWRFWGALVLTCALVMMLRHNGQPAVLGALAGLLLLDVRRWKHVAGAAVLTVLLVSGGRGALFRVYDAHPIESSMALVGYIGSHVQEGTPVTPQERELLNALHPLEDRWNYDCYSNVPTVFDGRFNMDVLGRHSAEMLPLFVTLTRRAPDATLKHLVCASTLIWKLPHGSAPLHRVPILRESTGRLVTITENTLSLRNTPLVPETLSQQFLDAMARTMHADLSSLFWNPALALYASVLACAVACARQRSWRQAAVLLPLLLHSLALALLIPSQDLRYQLPVIFVALLFSLAWLVLPRGPAQAPAGRPTA